jgi:hypothetical protein
MENQAYPWDPIFDDWDPLFDDYLGAYDYSELDSWLSAATKKVFGKKAYKAVFKPVEVALKPLGKALTPIAEVTASLIPGVGPILQTGFGQTLIYGQKAVQRAAQYGISPAEAAAASTEISKAEKEALAAGRAAEAQQLAQQRQQLMTFFNDTATTEIYTAPTTDKTMIYAVLGVLGVLAALFMMKKKK